ncbi:unnamed protein product [Calicophoron daubneyi]|uniref:protein-tyrosine-phosphatase n=1 Tax=Calicophoron daubneyi TaxID=300641 RepID=A0AAV2TC08_CALDB
MSLVTPRNSASSVNPSMAARNSLGIRPSGLKPKLSRQLQQPHITLIEYKTAHFIITDQPSPVNMDNFIVACHLHHVRVLVRVCESTYDEALLEAAGIQVVDLEFDDGAPPPDSVIETWFQLITDLWQSYPDGCIAVHCRAGLGRAPALVAVALIELGLPYDEAIEMIRTRRPGALNARQIQYLKNFRPHRRLRLKHQPDRCFIL